MTEVEKSLRSSTVLLYHGARDFSFDDVAAADIVLTTYETLRATLSDEASRQWVRKAELPRGGEGAAAVRQFFAADQRELAVAQKSVPCDSMSYDSMSCYSILYYPRRLAFMGWVEDMDLILQSGAPSFDDFLRQALRSPRGLNVDLRQC